MTVSILVLVGILAFFLFYMRYRARYLKKYRDVEPMMALSLTIYFMIVITMMIISLLIFASYTLIYDFAGVGFLIGLILFFVFRRIEINSTRKSIYFDVQYDYPPHRLYRNLGDPDSGRSISLVKK